MNSSQQKELWFWFRLLLAYLGLGFASALVAIWLSSPFTGWVRIMIRVVVFLGVFVLIEITAEKRGPDRPVEADPRLGARALRERENR